MESYEHLEREFAEFCGMEHVVACSSGTAALHLAFETLKFPRWSEVVMSDYNMIACPRACTLADLVPRFVDCGDDLTIDPDKVERECRRSGGNSGVGSRTNIFGVLAMHAYGVRCDMDALAKIAEDRSVYLIEDLAEAHGIMPHERTKAACWSFYKNKIVAGEEGGAVAFRCEGYADKARQLRCIGFTAAHDYTHVPRGHNYRLANCLADRIRDSLGKYEERVKWRWDNWEDLATALGSTVVRISPEVPWVFAFRVDRGMRGQLIHDLQEAGVPARYGFKPMTSQEEYKWTYSKAKKHPVAYAAGEEVLYLQLPLTAEQVETSVRVICEAVDKEKSPPIQ